ncbi:hypothetical protein K7X08_008314 [Anisodus acutangulus]|uniref:Uncharacterized protein n=1 Tax=Anisodus acutangulus TaxID=402998 RepID=A0A9Q1MTF9_9SOLA|nr:hypothetical protein K7X08_008314 [Anisodus acutangulus]
MRCKKHLSDLSSSVGVCATCLRERLFAFIAAQAQAQARVHVQQQVFHEDHRKSDSNPPPLVFPRSVSPYISRRKSDTTPWQFQHNSLPSIPDQRFYSTPQVGPNGTVIAAGPYNNKKKKGYFRFVSGLFRSKTEKLDSDPRVSNSSDPCPAASSSSPSWFSTILSGRRKKQSRTFSLEESTIGGHHRRTCRNRDRGMSPARYSDDEEDEHYGGSSGYSSESSQGWKQTPRRTPVAQIGRRGKASHNRNLTGMSFCLSPLVRASPSRNWNQKGMPPEMVFSGEIRAPAKPQLFTASSFCKNRSRKLADFGRFNPNR